MSLAVLYSRALAGMEAPAVSVEVHLAKELPSFTLSDLPDSVRDNLPKHAQEIYKAAFNQARDEYAGRGSAWREETAHKVAWSAVKKSYRKDEKNGKWLGVE